MSQKEILCTLGPASMNDRVIKRLDELGASLFRINLSHTALKDVARAIEAIQRRTNVPVCLDSEGAQIRTGPLATGHIEARENSVIRIHRRRVAGDARNLNFYPPVALDALRVGDLISIDFHSVLVQVIAKDRHSAWVRVLNGGRIGQNKAVTVERDIDLPVFTDKDRRAIRIGRAKGVRHFALSFANRPSDVDAMRKLCGKNAFLISKIECRNGLKNLDGIARRSDALLIDRGDLSRQEPIERIPKLQKAIIRRCKRLKRKVYVATNLLESMVTEPKPTRAEVNDVINTLMDGADGLVLAAETAIGKDPVGCAQMIVKLLHEYGTGALADKAYYPSDPCSLLVEPHGGRLVHREAQPSDLSKLERRLVLRVKGTDLMDCAQIAYGTYSPLTGFMDRRTLESVLEQNRLPDGTAWTMPILLQVDRNNLKGLSKGRRIALADARGRVHALMDVADIYRYDLRRLTRKWFGTDSLEHPGVARVMAGGDQFLGGPVLLVQKPDSPLSHYELTPAQSRFVFTQKGWSRVVGFHTRNVIHRAHEHIQLEALKLSHADGLYISPVLGSGRSGDFLPEIVIKSYHVMVDGGHYPPGKVVVGCFLTYPRFCGPREAVFTALCRKNMGCSHFIIGRNHTGVGDYYDDKAYPALFERLGDIGIQPVFFDAIGYDPRKKSYGRLSPGGAHRTISGTQVRRAIQSRQALPSWFMRHEIQKLLRVELTERRPVFYA